MQPIFLIAAPSYTYKSAGCRALYRLCHHLNVAGYPAAMISIPGVRPIITLPDWRTPLHAGEAGESIVIYPEVISGNPLKAKRVVRWVLNNPGLRGGDRFYDDDEMVFVFNRNRLPIVNEAVTKPLGPSRVLFIGLIDPNYIYPDEKVEKTVDCYYAAKGQALRERHPLPNEPLLQRLEDFATSTANLGELLRRTRILYSYNHASNVLKEAAVSNCRVLVVDQDGGLHDPEVCSCAYNIYWEEGFREGYGSRFHDSSFVRCFVDELRTKWPVPGPPAILDRRS